MKIKLRENNYNEEEENNNLKKNDTEADDRKEPQLALVRHDFLLPLELLPAR